MANPLKYFVDILRVGCRGRTFLTLPLISIYSRPLQILALVIPPNFRSHSPPDLAFVHLYSLAVPRLTYSSTQFQLRSLFLSSPFLISLIPSTHPSTAFNLGSFFHQSFCSSLSSIGFFSCLFSRVAGSSHSAVSGNDGR